MECTGGAAAPVPVAALRQRLTQDLRNRLPQPTVDLSPAGGTLVHLPTVFSTASLTAQTLPVTIPVPGQVRAEVSSYAWSFSDGGSASGPGRPYEPGRTPEQSPGYYLTHAFAEPGQGRATLTVTWQGTFTVDGVTIDLDPVVFTAAVTTPVREARSELVAGTS